VKRWEREKLLREGGVLDGTARSQAERRMVERDFEGNPFAGQRVQQRLRNFRPGVDTYVSSLHGPLAYMQRLRQIHEEELAHEERLRDAWLELAADSDGDAERFAASWRRAAARWNFTAINLLIDKHNRYFPAESRLPMDPRTGDFILVGGRPYRREPLDSRWVLARFPDRLDAARAALAA
jgi:hypothetical protein